MRMRTQLEILEFMYNIINVSDVTDLITGDIYYQNAPLTKNESALKYIVINGLPVLDNDGVINQTGIININIYFPVRNGEHDQNGLSTVTAAVLQELNDYSQQDDGSYFQFDIDSQSVYPDHNNPQYVYSNIKISYAAQRYYEEGD